MNKGIYSDSAIQALGQDAYFHKNPEKLNQISESLIPSKYKSYKSNVILSEPTVLWLFEEEKWMENKTCWKRRNIRPLPTLNCENHPKKDSKNVSKVIFATVWASLRRHSLNFRIKKNVLHVGWFWESRVFSGTPIFVRSCYVFSREMRRSLKIKCGKPRNPSNQHQRKNFINMWYVYDQSYRTQRSLLVHGHGRARCFNIRSPAKPNTNKNEHPQQKIDAGPRMNRKPSTNTYLEGVPAATSGRTLFLTTPRAPAYSGDEVGCLWQDAVWGFLVLPKQP